MKLFHSQTSPFVRKVMVAAHELGLAERIETLPSAVHPVTRDGRVLAVHPLAQVPTLILDGGEAIADSRVICEYLDALGGGRLFPAAGAARWAALNLQSTADAVLDAALLIRYELTARPEAERSQAWMDGQHAKIASALDWFETQALDGVDIGTIALACALGYLDLRFSDLGWREGRPNLAAWFSDFSERASMRATA